MRSFAPFLVAVLVALNPVIAEAQSGGRPRDVAVSPDGQTVLVTSWGSNVITVVINGQPTPLDVGGRSWGVAFLDDLRAVVTCPEEDFVVRLERSDPTDEFIKLPAVNGLDGELIGCSAVIAGAEPGTALIANRGRAPQGALDWQHSVLELDFEDGIDPIRFVTEREPRALALSPDGQRLYVGTVQGALGAQGIGTSAPGWFAHYDGGSVVSYETSSRLPLHRFSIGSPVRGLAIWENHNPTAKTRYRLFISSVGNGAQGEDPEFGGRLIANVVSSMGFKANHTASAPQHVVHDHDPEHEDAVDGPGMVLPETMVVRPSGGINDPAELWVLHSASGTVSRVKLDLFDGSIVTSGTFDLHAFANQDQDGDPYFKAVTAHDGEEPQISDAWGVPGIMKMFSIADVEDVFYTAPGGASAPRTANPRGITYDAANDRVLVTSQFEHRLTSFSTGATAQMQWSVSTGSGDVIDHERNFFTFGDGFDFREDVGNPGGKVNNLSCGTCHVDGHIDGKIRITKQNRENLHRPNTRDEPVAVPSIFDVGNTEWLFFEGLKTVVDTIEGGSCVYCRFNTPTQNGFFLDTINFTNTLASPPSPYAPDGQLSDAAKRGRGWFDRMNCGRCHQSATPQFRRTLESVSTPDGPLPQSLLTNNAFLHDGTQSFISSLVSGVEGQSTRNMTRVGSREDETNARRKGVNTPSLAGAWDNAPYMHDGRYSTLDEVLQHTWLRVDDEYRAAPEWALISAPDNAFNIFDLSDPVLPTIELGTPLFDFKSHSSFDPDQGSGDDWVSAADFLAPSAQQDLEAYLKSLSSETDPCGPTSLTMAQPAVFFMPGCQEVTIHWTTNLPVVCRVQIDRENGIDEVLYTTAATDHSIVTDYALNSHDQVNVSAQWCDESVQRTQAYFLKKCLFGASSVAKAASGIERISPNPFNPSTEIQLVVDRSQRVELKIFDLRGRMVRTLQDDTLAAGTHGIRWNGTDDRGTSVASGVYFLHLRMSNLEQKRKLILVE